MEIKRSLWLYSVYLFLEKFELWLDPYTQSNKKKIQSILYLYISSVKHSVCVWLPRKVLVNDHTNFFDTFITFIANFYKDIMFLPLLSRLTYHKIRFFDFSWLLDSLLTLYHRLQHFKSQDVWQIMSVFLRKRKY